MMTHGESYPLWRQLAAVLLCALLARVWVQLLFGSKAAKAKEPEMVEST